MSATGELPETSAKVDASAIEKAAGYMRASSGPILIVLAGAIFYRGLSLQSQSTTIMLGGALGALGAFRTFYLWRHLRGWRTR